MRADFCFFRPSVMKGAAPRWLAILMAALVGSVAMSGCQGKGVGGSCSDVAGCGGNLVGSWTANGFCQYAVNAPATDPSMNRGYTTPQSPSLAGADDQASAVTTGDWCQGLVILPGDGGIQIAHTNFSPPPLVLMSGTLQFSANNTYIFNLPSIAKTTEHLSRACIEAHGATTSCADLGAALAARRSINYANVSCADSSDGGCDCSLQLGDSGFDSGTWAVDQTNGIVYETSTNAGKGPRAASFCVTSDQNGLTLGGYDGATLDGGPAGLRTLTATRAGP